jgi:hypothetical protein
MNIKEDIRSIEIYDRNTFSARKDVIENWRNVKSACDYLEKQLISISKPKVARHVREVLKGNPGSQEHYYRDANEYGRYVDARNKEQAKKKGPSIQGKPQNEQEYYMRLPKEELVMELIWTKDEKRELKKDNDRLRILLGKLELNGETYLARIAGESPPGSANIFKGFMVWLARLGVKVTPLALLQYDHDRQTDRFSDENLISELAKACGFTVAQLVEFTEKERAK